MRKLIFMSLICLMTTLTSSRAQAKDLPVAEFSLRSGMLQGLVAKNIATCHFVSGLSVQECLKRAQLPIAQSTLTLPIDIFVHKKKKIVVVTPAIVSHLLGGHREVVVSCEDELYGCRIEPRLNVRADFCEASENWESPDSLSDQPAIPITCAPSQTN